MSINLPFDGTTLQAYANSLDTGHLKLWKANSLTGTLGLIPAILADEQRLLNLLRNSLSMEGFSDRDILQVKAWILNQMVDA